MKTMKAMKFLSACSVAFALIVVAPAWAQEDKEVTREAQEEEVLKEEAQAVKARAVSFTVRRVAVECNGPCDDVTLGEACGAGWIPIAVDCQNVCEHSSYSTCGSGSPLPRCRLTSLSPGSALSNFCDDVSGWDANVYCAQ